MEGNALPSTLRLGDQEIDVSELFIEFEPVVDPDTRKVRLSVDLFENMELYNAHGERLGIDWGEPDSEGFYSPVVSPGPVKDVDLTDEVLFRTSNDRIYQACLRCWPYEQSYAAEIARHVIRRLAIPDAP